jgi:tRNA1(Val) A37 N6-methylase TrmN6
MQGVGEFTIDLFHRGDFCLAQPVGKGHRAGIDAMILASAVPNGFRGRIADFGAGAGAAGLAVASRCPESEVVLVERSPEMVHFARTTLSLDENAGLAARVTILEADVTLTGRKRVEAGLEDRSVDFVIMNPPFNTAHDRRTPDTLKMEAHVMEEGMFENWLRSASAVVKPGGSVALIARPRSLLPILTALKGRFGETETIAIHAQDDRPAIRVIVRARRGSRGLARLWPPLILHEQPGNRFTARADAVNNGLASLFGD